MLNWADILVSTPTVSAVGAGDTASYALTITMSAKNINIVKM